MRQQDRDQLLAADTVLVIETGRTRTVEIEHADYPAAGHERHDQFRA